MWPREGLRKMGTGGWDSFHLWGQKDALRMKISSRSLPDTPRSALAEVSAFLLGFGEFWRDFWEVSLERLLSPTTDFFKKL